MWVSKSPKSGNLGFVTEYKGTPMSKRFLVLAGFCTAIVLCLGVNAVAPPAAQAEINRAKPKEVKKRKRKYVHPCPAGTEQFGEAPPEGGKVWCRQPIRAGYRKHGKFIQWYTNGAKRYEGEYIRNRKHGKWTTYHRNGEKKAEEEYYNGKRVKKIKFNRNGEQVLEKNRRAERKRKRLKYKWRNNMKY